MTQQYAIPEGVRRQNETCAHIFYIPKRDVDHIIKGVCALHGVSFDDLRGPIKTAHLVRARRDAARQLRALGMSTKRVGRLFNRHHTTFVARHLWPAVSDGRHV